MERGQRGRRRSPALAGGVGGAEPRQQLHPAPSKPALPRHLGVGEGMSPPGWGWLGWVDTSR